MKSLTLLTALTTLYTQVLANGRAVLNNKCGYDLYVWSVDVTGPGSPHFVPANGGSFSEEFRYNGGIALKACRTNNGLYNASPEFITSYTLDQNGSGKVW
jgi:hypothetical protein